MGTTRSSETAAFAEYLRSVRTLDTAEVTRRTLAHDADDLTASERTSFSTQEV